PLPPLRSTLFPYTTLFRSSLIAPHEALNRSDALSASQGATVCALVLARERAVLQAEDRLRRDVVTDLLSGASTSDSALLERAERDRKSTRLNSSHSQISYA